MFNFPKYYDIPELIDNAETAGPLKLLVLTEKTSETEEKLLHNILKATALDSNDILHIRIDPDEANHIRNQLNNIQPQHFLIFGIRPHNLGLHVQVRNYHPFRISQCQLCICDSLAALEKNMKAKKDLWNILKYWFKS